MTDRNVLQINPAIDSDEEKRLRPFSDFADQNNIVLLGDPGAGKSHLFRETARAEDGQFVTARTFLNVPSFPPNAVLFIDGLDERRAGRGDRGTIDMMVQKLFAVAPAKARISCRVADWLGQSDLAAFQPYFDHSGGAVVVGLQRLSDVEQRTVLATQDMNAAQADAFIQEAKDRGLEEFLENPQNLIMLVEVVKTGSWPQTRRDLFELSTRLLLSEPNREHVRAGSGSYTADELRMTAGAVCAVRLISDAGGVSLAEHEGDTDYPSYRTLTFLDPQKVQAMLGRRVFEAAPVAETVDYTHRTTAEFLGASWIASAIRAGLPLGRVQALIGVDGQPAPELRGLHAWLPVLLLEHADRLIEADPYGVLTYGDAASLTPSSRRHLLAALGHLSERDPWFRSGQWKSPAIGALARPDMVEAFRAVLNSSTANFGLRSIVVEALATGAPLPELKDDLAAVLTRQQSPYAERLHAMLALLRLGPDGKSVVAKSARELGNDDHSLRLRAGIIAELYGDGFGPDDVARLLGDTLAATDEITTGGLWSISSTIPISDIPAVLDQFEPIERELRTTLERQNVWEVASTFERLLYRILQNRGLELTTSGVWRWLRTRRSFRDTYGVARTTNLREVLRQKPELLRAIADHFLDTFSADANRWMEYTEFREIVVHAIESEQLLEWIVEHLPRVERGSDKEKFIYEIALSLTFVASRRALEIFSELYTLGDARSDLRPVRDRMMSSGISETLRLRNANRDQQRANDAENRRQKFEENAAAIRSGTHLGWLAFSGRVYFGFFSDLDQNATPRERLVGLLGEENTRIVIDGFIATLERPDIPTLESVAISSADHQVYDWWYALVAGMDERWRRSPGLDGFTDDLLRSVLAVVQANPTFVTNNSVSERRLHEWKSAILESRPELAHDAYVALARAALRKGEQHVEGLRELLNDEAFTPFRHGTILELLREFPNATPYRLDELLWAGLDLPATHTDLLALARAVHSSVTLEVGDEQLDAWLALAYLLAPSEFETAVQKRANKQPNFVFRLRNFSGYPWHGEAKPTLGLPMNQLEFLVRLIGSIFSETGYPSGGWGGDQNPWDAAEFVRYLVTVISTNTTEAASEALVRLEADNRLASYRQHIQHSLSTQQTRRREVEYDRPDWSETLRALTNGPPVNVSDLHALLLDHLADLKTRIASSNNDIYKSFWNEDSRGRTERPKPEESCRDVLVGLMRTALLPLGIMVEPEGHMAADRRADISVAMPGRKILCELKRDYHPDVWSALEGQLDRFYTIDPEAKGFGVYGVFWFGDKRPVPIRSHPRGLPAPQSPGQMEQMLRDLIPVDRRNRLAAVILDVSGAH